MLGPKLGRHVLHLGLAVRRSVWRGSPVVVGRGTGIDGWDLAPALFLSGFGVGLIFAPLFDIILADLGDREVGSGSGLLNAVQQFTGALGVAVLGTLLFGWLPDAGWFVATQHLIWVASGATPRHSWPCSPCRCGRARMPWSEPGPRFRFRGRSPCLFGCRLAPLAQSAERFHGKEKVYGSIP